MDVTKAGRRHSRERDIRPWAQCDDGGVTTNDLYDPDVTPQRLVSTTQSCIAVTGSQSHPMDEARSMSNMSSFRTRYGNSCYVCLSASQCGAMAS